jgi:hypothetical protein
MDLYPKLFEGPKQLSTAPETPLSSSLADAGEKEDLLFQIVKGLNVEAGFERSFKIANGALLNNRFLLGIKKEAIGQMADDRFIEACGLMGMPENFLDTFKHYLPHGNYVHFGFEQNEQTTVYKVYLEFFDAIKKDIKKSPEHPAPALLHLGLKWDVVKPAQAIGDAVHMVSLARFYRDTTESVTHSGVRAGLGCQTGCRAAYLSGPGKDSRPGYPLSRGHRRW